MTGRRLVRALDLIDDADLIAAYEGWHKQGAVWAAVVEDIYAQGVLDMEIWRVDDRLVMIMEVADDYPRAVTAPELVSTWEGLMDKFQRRLPSAGDEKWVSMKRIFALADQRRLEDAG